MTQPERTHPDSPPAPEPSPTHEVSTEGTDPGAGASFSAGPDFSFLSPPPGPGELGRLGGYRVLEVLGAGGMGLVFRAEDPALRRPVALKVMRPELLARPQAADRFLREARAAAAVKHDHIVTIYQVGQDRGVPFLALEFLSGEPLDARARRDGRLPAAEVRRIGYETALGLAAAHAAGLVHRDVKPANIWLEAPHGRVKILDFGLARAGPEDVHLTGPGMVIGTPAYMSPEQANGQPVDARSDLFSLGALLYRLATGRLPFEGSSPMAILTAMATRTPVPAERLVPDLPPDLAEVIRRLLTRRPEDRIPTARAAADRLAPSTPSVTIVTAPLAEPAYLEQFDFDDPGEDTRPVAPPVVMADPPARPARPEPRLWIPRALVGLCALVLVLGSARLGAHLIEVKTARGTLVVETDDPAVEVVVKKDGAVIRDRTRDREIDLKVGDYTIELAERKDGLRLSTREFTIERNGKAVVRARVDRPAEPKAVAVAPTALGRVDLPPLPATFPLDALDPAKIPAAERRPWHPTELVAVIGTDRHRHWGGILKIAYSPNGDLIATTGNDVTVRLWDAETLDEKAAIRTYPHHQEQTAAYFAPDGSKLAVWRNPRNGTSLYDVRRMPPRLIMEFPTAHAVSAPFFADGRRLLLQSGDLADAQVWDVSGDRPRLVKTLAGFNHGHSWRSVVAGDRVLTVNPHGPQPEDRVAVLWDVSGAAAAELDRCRLDAHEAAVSPDGKWFAMAGTDAAKKVRVFDLSGGKFREDGSFDIDGLARASHQMAFLPATGDLMFATYDGVWRLRDRAAGTTRVLNGDHPTHMMPGNPFAPDGRRSAARSNAMLSLLATFDFTPDGKLTLRHAPDLTANPRPSGNSAWAVSTYPAATRWALNGLAPAPQPIKPAWAGHPAAVLPDGRVVARQGQGGPLAVYDPGKGDGADPVVWTVPVTSLAAVEASPGGRWLVVGRNGDGDRSPDLFELVSGKPVRLATLADHSARSPAGCPVRFEFTADDRFLLSWNSSETRLWDLRGSRPVHLAAPAGPPGLTGTSAALAADRPTVVVGTATGHVRLFDFSTGRLAEGPAMRPFDRLVAGAVMLCGARVLMACDDTGTIKFVEVPSGKDVREPMKFPGPVSLRLAPDGRHVFAEAPAGGPLYVLRLDLPAPPLDEVWVRKVAGLTPEQQVEEVRAELKRRNPLMDPADVKASIAGGKVTHLSLSIEHVTDIAPVRAIPDLTGLTLRYASPDNSAMFNWLPLRRFRDLTPLRGMKLKALTIWAAAVEDLGSLSGMPLETLFLNNCRYVRDLSPLRGMPLTFLNLGLASGVSDLSPLAGMPIQHLFLDHSGVTDLRAVAGMPLKRIALPAHVPLAEVERLRGVESLATINQRPAADFWAGFEVKK